MTDDIYCGAVSAHLSSPRRLQALGIGFLVLVLAGALLTGPITHERARLTASTVGQHTFHRIATNAAFRDGRPEGVRIAAGSVTMSRPRGRLGYAGGQWSWSRWTSAWIRPGQPFTELIPSWNVITPSSTMVQVQARAQSTAGKVSGFKVMGSWATRDAGFRRTSGASQRDAVAWANTDTLTATSGVRLAGFQLRVLILRRTTSTATPTVRSLQAVASRPAAALPATSKPVLRGKALNVPRYSQMTHRGQYPQYGGGGEAWCSPTALSMLLGYFGALPPSSTYAWVDKRYADRWVDHVARLVYDYGYQGAGNWAFNTAYAANRTSGAFVTRLRNLREAERFIRVGIPLAASISFARGQLTGAPISATAGHLVVIAGFTRAGNVVVNDPAAPRNTSVRRVYERGQFERAWLRRSSGTVYVVRDVAHPLPSRGSNRNW